MTTLTLEKEPEAKSVECTDEHLIVHLKDGRTLMIPLSWYPRLAYGTPEERANYELFRDGYGIHWPDLDEDLHVPGLLEGRRSGESKQSFERWKQQLDARRNRADPGPWVAPQPLPDWWEEEDED